MNWQSKLQSALIEKFKSAYSDHGDRVVARIDVGIFAWHSSIELSFLFSDDSCDVSDIASWPNYDYSKLSEGRWPAAVEVAQYLNSRWSAGDNLINILKMVATVVKSQDVSVAIQRFNLAPDFSITVLNPDNSKSQNYCA